MRSGGPVKERNVFSKAKLCIFQEERMEERGKGSSLSSAKHLVQKYAPKNRRPEDNNGGFYQKLQKVSDRLLKKDVDLSKVDANANIDSDTQTTRVMRKL